MPIERSRRCNEINAPEDNESEILSEQSRQAKDQASESSQHPEVIMHRASCILTSHSWLYNMYHYAASATQLTITFEFAFSSFQRPE